MRGLRRFGKWDEHFTILKGLIKEGKEVCVISATNSARYIEAFAKEGMSVESKPVKSTNKSKIWRRRDEERIIGFSLKLKSTNDK